MRNGLRPGLGLALLVAVLGAAGAAPAAAQTAYSVQSDGDDRLYRIDLATGVATAIGASGFGDLESFAFAPGCTTLYAVDDVRDVLVTCNMANGSCRAVGNLGVDITDTGLSFGPDGALYMSTDAPKNPTRLYRLDTVTGRATLVGDQGQEVTGLAGDMTTLYGLGGDGRDNLVKIDTTTGAATEIGPLGTVALDDGGIDFDAHGVLWGIDAGSGRHLTGPSQIFTVDPATGRATVVRTVVSPGGRPLNGFEGLAIADGICTQLGRAPSVLELPVASGWGLAALALALLASAFVALRRA
jgi:uncharacterized protein DUF4394